MSILQRHVIFTESDGGKGPKLQLDLCSVEYCANFTLVYFTTIFSQKFVILFSNVTHVY